MYRGLKAVPRVSSYTDTVVVSTISIIYRDEKLKFHTSQFARRQTECGRDPVWQVMKADTTITGATILLRCPGDEGITLQSYITNTTKWILQDLNANIFPQVAHTVVVKETETLGPLAFV